MLEFAVSIRPRAPCADDRPLEVPITDTQRNEASFPAQAADLDLLLHLRRNAGRQLSWSSARTGCNALSRRSAAARFAAGDTSTTGCQRFAAATGGRAASGRPPVVEAYPLPAPPAAAVDPGPRGQNGGADSGGQQRAGGRCCAARGVCPRRRCPQRQPSGWSAKPLPRYRVRVLRRARRASGRQPPPSPGNRQKVVARCRQRCRCQRLLPHPRPGLPMGRRWRCRQPPACSRQRRKATCRNRSPQCAKRFGSPRSRGRGRRGRRAAQGRNRPYRRPDDLLADCGRGRGDGQRSPAAGRRPAVGHAGTAQAEDQVGFFSEASYFIKRQANVVPPADSEPTTGFAAPRVIAIKPGQSKVKATQKPASEFDRGTWRGRTHRS